MDGYVTIGTELDTSGVEKNLNEMSKIIEKKSEEAANKASKKMSAAFVLGASVMTSVVNKIMNAIGNAMNSAVSRVDILNNFPRVMESLGINAEDAAESVNYLSNKLIGLPTTLDEGVKAVQRFTSANKDVKASTEMYLALNNALLAGGTGPEQQAIAMEQMSQAYAKGKMDYKEWLSIMQTAPAQMRQVAEAMGYVNIEQFGKDLREGAVSMNDFMATLVKMNHESVNGFTTLEEQAREGTRGIKTSITNLKTTIVRAVGEAMQAIGQANIAGFFQAITDTIKKLIPYIAAFVKSFMVAFTAIVSIIGKIGKFFGNLFGKKGRKDNVETGASYEGVAVAIGDVGTSADDAAGSAKKLKKELANLQGFDEMNILQEPSDSSGKGGGASADVGDIGDLGALSDINFGQIGEEVKALGLNFDLVTAAVWGLVAALTAFKVLKWLDNLGLISMTTGEIFKVAAGIGLLVSGIILIVKGVIDYLKDPSWENFITILAGIALAAAGVALIFGAIPALITAAVLLIGALALAIYKHWDEIKATLAKVGSWIYDNVISPVIDFFKDMWETIKEIFSPFIDFFANLFSTIFENIKITINNIKQIVGLLWEGIKGLLSPIANWIYDKIIRPIANFFSGLWEGIKNGVFSAINIVKKYFNDVVNFFKGIISTITNLFKEIGTKVGDVIGSAFKNVINFVLSFIEGTLNKPINAINSLIGKINELPGVNLTKLNTFKFPRLAQGGIVNNPGRGVMMGSYIAGERGPEAVLPLDNQTMDRLGEAIARHMSINNDNKIYLNARQIARQLNVTQFESDFAFNR